MLVVVIDELPCQDTMSTSQLKNIFFYNNTINIFILFYNKLLLKTINLVETMLHVTGEDMS